MAERFAELSLCLVMARHTKLRLVRFEHCLVGLTGLLCCRVLHIRDRTGLVIAESRAVSGMAVGTANVVAPVIAASEIIVAFLAGVACETGFRRGLGVKTLERNYFRYITGAFDVFLTGSMARFASDYLSLPGR